MATNPVEVYKCNVCGIELSDPAELETHLEGHAEKIAEGASPLPQPPKCAFCGKTFDGPEELREHHATAHRR